MKWQYLGISSEYRYEGTFDQFKKELEQTHIFQKIPQKERSNALKEAFKIATKE